MGCDTVNGADNPEEWGFLLTHPVWDVTPNRTRKRPTMRKISTHTSRVGCDKNQRPEQHHVQKFLLTHPVWDVTEEEQRYVVNAVISTHTSRVGCDRYI